MEIKGLMEIQTAELAGEKYEYEISRIYIDGIRLDPENYQNALHASDEFQWGYGGSGPAFLAYVILLLATMDPDLAKAYHQPFKWQHVATWPFGKDFTVNIDVPDWIQAQKRFEDDRYPMRNGGK